MYQVNSAGKLAIIKIKEIILQRVNKGAPKLNRLESTDKVNVMEELE